jgi:hypothetical protein
MSCFARAQLLSIILSAPVTAQGLVPSAPDRSGLPNTFPPARNEPDPKDRSVKPLLAPQKPIPAEQVQPLIDALGSKDYKSREKAHKDLLAADDRVLPHLEAALEKTDSPEVQRRLEVIVERLKRDRALRASRVSVHAKGLSAKTVLKDICRQAGYTLNGELNEPAKVTLDLDDVPFWEALDKVCDPLGLAVDLSGPEDRGVVNVYSGEVTHPYTCVTGPFKFVATNISSSKSVQLSGLPRRGGGVPSSEYLSMSAQVFAEPKLPIVALGPVRLTKAVDDRGQSLIAPQEGLPQSSAPLANGGYYRSLSQSLGFGLVRGDKEATSIKELRGVVPVLLLTDVKAEVEVDDILSVKNKKIAARSCDLEVVEVKQADGEVTAKVVFTPRVTPEDGDNYSWWSTLPQRMVLTDDKGTRFVYGGVNEQQQGAAAVTCTLQFSPPPDRRKAKPATLMLTYWVTVQKDVEFTFKNVPLP